MSNQVQDCSVQEMARAPKLPVTFGLDHIFPQVAGGALTFNGNLKYTASYVPDRPALFGPLSPGMATDQRYRQGSYALVIYQDMP